MGIDFQLYGYILDFTKTETSILPLPEITENPKVKFYSPTLIGHHII